MRLPPSLRELRRQQGEIAVALGRVATSLTPALERRGWERRPFSTARVASFTKSSDDGFLVAVEVDVAAQRRDVSFVFWPLKLTIRFGTGFEPAIALMPVLTLDPRAVLVRDLTIPLGTARFNGPDDAELVARRIAGFVRKYERRPDSTTVAAVEASLSAAQEDESELATQRRLVLLAATGQLTRARAVLDGYVGAGHGKSASFQRFTRQLRRWLDAEGPTPPPVEQTLALLPRRVSYERRPPWKTFRQRGRVRDDVRRQLRGAARGKPREEVVRLLVDGYSARGVEPPALMTADVKYVEIEWRTLGRLQSYLYVVPGLISLARAFVKLLRHRQPRDPRWMRPPENASYPLVIGSRRCATVRLDPAAADWLVAVARAGGRRAAGLVTVDAWLSEPVTEADEPLCLVVHLGDRPVGTLSAKASQEYAPELAAARLYDEVVPVRASLLPADRRHEALLELKLPAPFVHP